MKFLPGHQKICDCTEATEDTCCTAGTTPPDPILQDSFVHPNPHRYLQGYIHPTAKKDEIMRDRPRMNIQRQPKPRISPTGLSCHSLHTSTRVRVPPPYSSPGHSTNRASSSLTGPARHCVLRREAQPGAARKESSGACWKHHSSCRTTNRESTPAVCARTASSSASVVTTCCARRAVTDTARAGR